MTTKLTDPLRREIDIDGEPFTVVLTARGIRLARKRFRDGRAVTWKALWESGELEHSEDGGPSGDPIHGQGRNP
jgi:hypothetical protein